ncbi:MAG: hypothetical protein LBG80_06525, partial [Bacteroidales bacterium]|nr:hypothetical protein [Bacteroidales bacterium]
MRHVRYYQVDLHSVPIGTGKKGRYSSVSTNILSLRVGCSKPIKSLKTCLLWMINEVDKTLFTPYLK